MTLQPSYQQGFAPRDYEPLYPELWRGCVGAWAPCLGATGTVLRDHSGYGNHGALQNMDPGGDWVVSGGKGGLDFDGSNDTVSLGNSSRLQPSEITFSMWYYRTASLAFNGCCFFWAKPNGTYNGKGFYIEPGSPAVSNKIWIMFDDTNNAATIDTAHNLLPLNTWTSFMFTLKNGVCTFYINSKSVASNTNGGVLSITSTSDTKYMFSNSPTYNNYTPGTMDDLRIYSRALTEQEIRLLASERGIAYKQRSKRRFSQQAATGSRRLKLLTGLP